MLPHILYIGKSTLARAECNGSYYLKEAHKWWDDYNYEDTVIIEDLSPSIIGAELARLLLQWCDRYVAKVEIKGGSITIRPKTFIITSNFTIAECFGQWNSTSMCARFPNQRDLTGSVEA